MTKGRRRVFVLICVLFFTQIKLEQFYTRLGVLLLAGTLARCTLGSGHPKECSVGVEYYDTDSQQCVKCRCAVGEGLTERTVNCFLKK